MRVSKRGNARLITLATVRGYKFHQAGIPSYIYGWINFGKAAVNVTIYREFRAVK